MKSFTEYRISYAGLYEAVKEKHTASSNAHSGHGLDHDVTVAQLAAYIAPDEISACKAWCAGMLHSLDRLVAGNPVLTESLTRSCAATLTESFGENDIEEIILAALRHSEKNKSDQSSTQQILMDADRLANLNAAIQIRAGQFQPLLPAFEFTYLAGKPNPASTYAEPKSVLDDLRSNITEYFPQLRFPKAQELGAQYVERLKQDISRIEADYEALGLIGIEL